VHQLLAKGGNVKTVILACNTIKDELEKAALEIDCQYPFRWVESGLHLRPDSLRQRMQEELDSITGVERVLLGFGFCGNAAVGLVSRDYELIIPKVDDCISLLLGSMENREQCSKSGAIYFLTKGWLEGELNIWKEYQAVLARFGPERTERIYQRMLAHYKFLGLIDTGAYDLDALLPVVNEIALKLKLETCVLQGSDQYVKKLLSGPWDEDGFVTLPKHTRVELFHLNSEFMPKTSRALSL
jgi:hypothetical protein